MSRYRGWLRLPFLKTFAYLLLLSLLIGSCGDDGLLTSEEREWCSITDATEESAVKFDLIFEAGLNLELQMDVINARAGVLNEEYAAEGMSVDEAARAVSGDLIEMDDYMAACQEAFAFCSDYYGLTDEDLCP